MRFIIGRPKTKEENMEELNRIIESYENLGKDFLIMALVRKEDNQFIGTCGVLKNLRGEHEIGFIFLFSFMP